MIVRKPVLEKSTQVRFQVPVKLELAVEAYMREKGVEKSDAFVEFLMGSETLRSEIEKIEKLHR